VGTPAMPSPESEPEQADEQQAWDRAEDVRRRWWRSGARKKKTGGPVTTEHGQEEGRIRIRTSATQKS